MDYVFVDVTLGCALAIGLAALVAIMTHAAGGRETPSTRPHLSVRNEPELLRKMPVLHKPRLRKLLGPSKPKPKKD